MSGLDIPGGDPPEQPGAPARVADGFEMRHHLPGEQPSLFRTEDLVIPPSLRTMRKAVSAIHASPIGSEHSQSLNSRRLFDACILAVQLDFAKRDRRQLERVRTERITPVFEIKVADLAELAHIPGKNYERIYAELDKLFAMSLRWNLVGEDAEVEWEMKSHFLSSIGYGKGVKRGIVRFSIDPAILEIIVEPSNWATLSLQAMEGLGTSASYALYQNCFKYIGTHAKVTAALTTATWVELLVGPSRYLEDDGNGGKRVRNYGDFKRRVLMDALRRVNESPALSYTLELKEIFSGLRVVRLQFKFIPKLKGQAELDLPLTWPDDVLTVMANLGLTEAEIRDLSQVRSHEEVAEAVVRLKAAEARLRAAGRGITSRKAYFHGILSNIAAGAAGDELVHERIEEEVRAQEAQQQAERRQARLREEFARHQADRFAERLFTKPEPWLKSLQAEFESSTDGAKARMLLDKGGWQPRNVGLLAILRGYLTRERPDLLDQLLDSPEDRTFEAWLAWRLENRE